MSASEGVPKALHTAVEITTACWGSAWKVCACQAKHVHLRTLTPTAQISSSSLPEHPVTELCQIRHGLWKKYERYKGEKGMKSDRRPANYRALQDILSSSLARPAMDKGALVIAALL